MKNIAFVWEQYSWGGVDTHSLYLLRYLANKGYKITIFTNPENSGADRISNDLKTLKSVSVVKIRIWSQAYFCLKYSPSIFIRGILFALFPIFLVHNFFTFYKTLTSSFDVLYVQNGAYPGGWAGLISIFAAKLKNIHKIMLIIHHSSTTKRKFWFLLEVFIDKLVYKFSNAIVTVSKATKSSFLEKRSLFDIDNKVKVIYNGIDYIGTNVIIETFSKGKFKVGIIGRCEERKGHLDLIEAVRILPEEELKNFHFYFIGHSEDSFLAKITNLVASYNLEEYFTITGYLELSTQDIISNLDIVCSLTRDYEGFGLTVVEGMLGGKFVLTTTVGALSEFVEHGVNCYTVNPLSPDDIKDGLIKYHADIEFRERVSKNAIKTGANFNVSTMGQQYEDLIFS